MALLTLKLPLPLISAGPSIFSSQSSSSSPISSSSFCNCKRPYISCSLPLLQNQSFSRKRRMQRHIVRMAPEEEKMTRRSPLDFPIEWERPKPGRRPDIFPQFSPMKTPLPPPLPSDPPEEDEEEEEKKEEEEEDPEKEETDEPEKQ
ncbi:lysine-specific demethylase 2A-like [Quillaja saponaria]|uniref:Lysine-specific demethylase 2A-like n=1 Tax=Quillaja saponaria TaxID=32244 RepID=A0AAD7PEF8_QUISA|nr:lysine-specific demethylase 2A-like [Quillaja saponaria]